MKKLLIFAFLSSSHLYAEEFFVVPPINFQIVAENVFEKLELTFKYPENLLKKFKPEGATIDNKSVSNNVLRFMATKKILFVTKSVQVNAILDVYQDNTDCAKNQLGHRLVLSFDESDELVVDNISRLEAIFCTINPSSNKLIGTVKGKIYKGNNFSTIGYLAKGLIEAQINPLVKALNEEIKSMK